MVKLARACAREREVFNMIGYRPCRECGKETNAVDLTGGLCFECQRPRVARLSDLQRRYEAARRSGADAGELAGEIRAYQQTEGVRLRAIAPAYRVE